MNIIFEGQPLSTQTIYRSACRGKFPTLYMTKRGKEMKEYYQYATKEQYSGKIEEGDCEVKITLYFKSKHKHDIDNFNKLILDSLQGIVYKDDVQIQDLLTKKRISVENPRVELEINFI